MMFPRWLPLYLLGLGALTLLPYAAPLCPRQGWILDLGSVDFAANLLAFVPLGAALRRARPLPVAAIGFALSFGIEFAQQWLPRQQDTGDLLANTAGALFGWAAARIWVELAPRPLVSLRTRAHLLRGAAAVVLVAIAYNALSIPAHDFSNWDRFPLVIGNTARGDRPWIGDLFELALYDRALEPRERTARLEPADAPALWAEGGPVLWLRFDQEPPAGRIDGPSGPVRLEPRVDPANFVSDSGLRLAPGGVVLEPWISDHATEQLRGAGALTLDLRLRAGVSPQFGGARIVSFGNGKGPVNLEVGQRGAGLFARVRTPANGTHAARVEVAARKRVVSTEPQQLRFVYDGRHGGLWVDGACVDDSYIALHNSPWLVGSLLGLSIVASTALAALALASFARRRAARVLLGGLGGAAAWLAIRALGGWSALPDFETPALVLGATTLAATLPMIGAPETESPGDSEC